MNDLLPGYQQTEYGTFPCDWKSVTVASTASRAPNAIVGGPFGSDLVSSDYTEAGVPVIRGQNMGRKFVSGGFAFVSHGKAKILSANCAGWNDLVFTQRGTLGQVSIVPNDVFDRYVVSQSQMKISVDQDRFNPEYLYYYFTSPAGQRQITDSAIQTGVPHTNLGILRRYRLSVPPTVAEQSAIAETLGDADALIEGLETLIAKKRDIKQGAMQELLTGDRRLPGFQGHWRKQKLGSAVAIRNEKVQTHDNALALRCIELEQISSATGRVDRLVDATDRYATKYRFQPGDVLFGRLRPYLRKYWLADEEGVCSTEIWPLVPLGGLVDHGFLFFSVQTEGFIVAAGAAYGTHMPRADWKMIADYELVLPPTLDEQRAIATVLSDMDTEIIALEDKLAKARAVKQGMMQVLLTGEIRLI